MKRTLRALAAALLLGWALSAPASGAGAVALSGRDPLMYVGPGGGVQTWSFVPPANSEYAVYLFPTGEEAAEGSAELTLDGEIVASGAGSGALCSAWLVAGERYELALRSTGPAAVEIARAALSRCFGEPLTLAEGEPSGKMIARAWDAHWYAFEAAADGRAMLTCVPEEPGLELSALLFDGRGRRIAEFEELPGGACMLLADVEAGERYALRVCAPGGQTGYYILRLHGGDPDAITVALRFDGEQPRTLAAGSAIQLAALLDGEALLWASDAPEIVAVTQDGVAAGASPGVATITAYGLSSQASYQIEVVEIPLQGLRILGERIELEAGSEAAVAVARFPQNASDRSLSFEVSDPEIARVSADGVLTGISPGETTLSVTGAAGTLRAEARVTVTPAGRKYRALLVGEQRYPFGGYSERTGSENSVNALAALLQSGRFEATRYAVRTGSDLSRAELIAEIRAAFEGAREGDVSLFYITCHGRYVGGMSLLELSDGSALSARDLERELRRVPGAVVALIDCCGSGGAIGAASERAAFARGVTGAFSGAAIRGSKYRVLCSAMGADADYDGAITLEELSAYMGERVDWYLARASELTGDTYRQSVHAYPEGDPFILFE